MDASFEKFLSPTPFIESDHPAVVEKAAALTETTLTVDEKARRVFYFVRDAIRYVFKAELREEPYRASEILKAGQGFCTQKAILFCAMARSCGIPAGIHFYDIVDHTLPRYIVDLLKTRSLYHHGVAALYLNGAWRVYDATLDIGLAEEKRIFPVEFHPDRDCLMLQTTPDGRKHIDYVEDYGLAADVSFEELMSWFRSGYPHLFG